MHLVRLDKFRELTSKLKKFTEQHLQSREHLGTSYVLFWLDLIEFHVRCQKLKLESLRELVVEKIRGNGGTVHYRELPSLLEGMADFMFELNKIEKTPSLIGYAEKTSKTYELPEEVSDSSIDSIVQGFKESIDLDDKIDDFINKINETEKEGKDMLVLSEVDYYAYLYFKGFVADHIE